MSAPGRSEATEGASNPEGGPSDGWQSEAEPGPDAIKQSVETNGIEPSTSYCKVHLVSSERYF